MNFFPKIYEIPRTRAAREPCVDFAVANGAKILSNSWGGGGYSQSLKDAIEDAKDAGVMFIAAAGNSYITSKSIPLVE